MQTRRYIVGEYGRYIGYAIEDDKVIQYFSMEKGLVGTFVKSVSSYQRVISIPGKPMNNLWADEGESDIRYLWSLDH